MKILFQDAWSPGLVAGPGGPGTLANRGVYSPSLASRSPARAQSDPPQWRRYHNEFACITVPRGPTL
jgi:hypothetical protein